MDSQKPVRPNIPAGNKPVRPNIPQGQGNTQGVVRPQQSQPVRPKSQQPVRPSGAQAQQVVKPQPKPVRPQAQQQQPIQKPVQPSNKPVQHIQKPVKPVQNNVQPMQQFNQPQMQQQMQQQIVQPQNQMQQPASNEAGFIGQPMQDMDYSSNMVNNNVVNKQIQDNTKGKHKKEKKPKEKKVKQPKQPKQPKQHKQPQQPQPDENGNIIVQPKKDKRKIAIIAIIILAVVLLAIVGIKLIKAFTTGQQHITLAEEAPAVTNDGPSITELAEQSVSDTEIVEQPKDTNDTGEVRTQTPTTIALNSGDNITIPLIVNTKLEGDEQYKDYNSYLTFSIQDVIIGYDNIVEFVDEHNKASSTVVNVGERDEFYSSQDHSDLVMYSVSMNVPADFPTQDTREKRAFIKPTLSLMINGTEEEGKLIKERYVYNVPKLSDISDDTSELVAGGTYTFRWIAVMPLGLDNESYNLSLIYSDEDNTYTYTLNGTEIPEPEGVEEDTNNEETNTEETKDSTNTNEDTKESNSEEVEDNKDSESSDTNKDSESDDEDTENSNKE